MIKPEILFEIFWGLVYIQIAPVNTRNDRVVLRYIDFWSINFNIDNVNMLSSALSGPAQQ